MQADPHNTQQRQGRVPQQHRKNAKGNGWRSQVLEQSVEKLSEANQRATVSKKVKRIAVAPKIAAEGGDLPIDIELLTILQVTNQAFIASGQAFEFEGGEIQPEVDEQSRRHRKLQNRANCKAGDEGGANRQNRGGGKQAAETQD